MPGDKKMLMEFRLAELDRREKNLPWRAVAWAVENA